jgi:hypothetical protein
MPISDGLARPFRKDKETEVQSVIVSKRVAKTADAARTLVPSGFSTSGVDETEKSFRFRQHDPSSARYKRFRIKHVKHGVEFVIGVLR